MIPPFDPIAWPDRPRPTRPRRARPRATAPPPTTDWSYEEASLVRAIEIVAVADLLYVGHALDHALPLRFRILRALGASHPHPHDASCLARELGVQRQTVNEAVARMKRDGWIAIELDANDARSRSVWLTQGGVEQLRAGRATLERIAARLFAFVPLTERAALVERVRELRLVSQDIRRGRLNG